MGLFHILFAFLVCILLYIGIFFLVTLQGSSKSPTETLKKYGLTCLPMGLLAGILYTLLDLAISFDRHIRTTILVCHILLKDIAFYAPMMLFFARHILSYFFKSEKGMHVRSIRNIPYGDGSSHRQRLNVYVPKAGRRKKKGDGDEDDSGVRSGEETVGEYPVVLFVHGGTWTSGNKFQYHRLGVNLSQMGLVTVVMNYRVYPRYGRIDDQIEDVELVVRWIIDNIERFGGNVQNVHLVGHSAGSHLIAMWALRRHKYWNDVLVRNITCNREMKLGQWHPRSITEFCGIYDILQHYEVEKERKVQDLSAMKPNMGGVNNFSIYSPVYAMFEKDDMTPPLCMRLPPRVHIFACSADLTLRNEVQAKRYARELRALVKRESRIQEMGRELVTKGNPVHALLPEGYTVLAPRVTYDELIGFSHSDPVMCLMGLERHCTDGDGDKKYRRMLQIIEDIVVHGNYKSELPLDDDSPL